MYFDSSYNQVNHPCNAMCFHFVGVDGVPGPPGKY